ncbi:MAG: RusA family crossover junction endodeoxyribonuclease [Firmicutes bacterium]|nr:RusA family crossover junction endodeoxyribonuclease [Bacillota bacterium]
MRAEIVIPGRPVTKKNHQQVWQNRKSGKRFVVPSKAYKEYEESALRELRAYQGPRFSGPVRVTAQYYMPDRRSWPDLVGLMQATHDILQAAGIIANDRDIVCVDGSLIAGVDPKRPRVVIEIEEVS